jgi:hypothetical protein
MGAGSTLESRKNRRVSKAETLRYRLFVIGY